MKLRSYLYPAIVSAIALAGFRAAERPRYGGTLRVEIGASVVSLDPAQGAVNAAEASAKIDLLPLVFETLVVLDANGVPQPGLASSWDHDPSGRRWNFYLRPGVRFHDGSPLTPSAAVSALSNVDPSWHVSSSSDAVSIETSTPTPDLPFLLAEPRHALAPELASERGCSGLPFGRPGSTLFCPPTRIIGRAVRFWIPWISRWVFHRRPARLISNSAKLT